jgi:two-component system, chemotaxis family, protein-glutamate methylesterase/glutaminase
MKRVHKKIRAVVIGASAGGLAALQKTCRNLDKKFSKPIVIVQHIHAHSDGFMAWHLNSLSLLKVKEAEDKETLENGVIYVAPANYHILIDENCSISLTTDERVNYSRPSIDMLFESAADVFQDQLVGVILTGANGDGTAGMNAIKQHGGITVIQDPQTAEVRTMPESVLRQVKVDQVLSLEKISEFLNNLN